MTYLSTLGYTNYRFIFSSFYQIPHLNDQSSCVYEGSVATDRTRLLTGHGY